MFISKNVLFSIHPRWTYKILIREKRIEIRKRPPTCKLPFRGYIYCTQDKKFPLSLGPFGPCNLPADDFCTNLQGMVVGSFICNEIREYTYDENNPYYDISDDDLILTGLTQEDLYSYGNGKPLYGIVISEVVVFDEPIEKERFWFNCPYYNSGYLTDKKCDNCKYFLSLEKYGYENDVCCECTGTKLVLTAPQSWQYVEELPYDNIQGKTDIELQRIMDELFSCPR